MTTEPRFINFTEPGRHDRPGDLEIGVHATRAGRVVVIYAGHGTTVEGRGGKYVTIARELVRRGAGAVVHASDPHGRVDDLVTVLDWVGAHAREITGGCPDPELFLGGHSAGAAGVARVAQARDAQRLLLIGLPGPIDLSGYRGRLFVTVGSRDVLGTDPSRVTFDSADNAASRQLVIVPGVEHGFHGPRSHILYRRAFDWGFLGDTGYPSLRTRPGPDAPLLWPTGEPARGLSRVAGFNLA